jgi:hypothetical protein
MSNDDQQQAMSDEYIYEQTKQQSTKVLGEREEV